MIQKYTCHNGLRIVLEEIPTVRSVAIGIWIGTGSRNENEKTMAFPIFLSICFSKGRKKERKRHCRGL